MMNRNTLLVIFAIFAFFAVNFSLRQFSPLFSAEPANRRVVETGPSDQVILPPSENDLRLGGAFVGLHGSWNRSTLVGYKVAFVPFQNGKPSGTMEDFLTGFIVNPKSSDVYGRPVGVAVWTDGSLLVSDDGAGKIWRVSVKK